jgi:uncharacterized protein (TIGR02217 family)
MPLIFPTLPGLAWSVTKAPTFQTRIQRAVSGHEVRALDYPYPLWQFSLVFAFLRDDPKAGFDELRTLMGFYLSCQGAYATFLFQDPNDCYVSNQYLGIGDSSTYTFQLQRTMGTALPNGGFTEPVVAPNSIGAIYLNGVIQDPASYSIDANTGAISFSTPPINSIVITADFSYRFRCRFVDDSYNFENFMYRLWQLKKLTFISVFS